MQNETLKVIEESKRGFGQDNAKEPCNSKHALNSKTEVFIEEQNTQAAYQSNGQRKLTHGAPVTYANQPGGEEGYRSRRNNQNEKRRLIISVKEVTANKDKGDSARLR